MFATVAIVFRRKEDGEVKPAGEGKDGSDPAQQGDKQKKDTQVIRPSMEGKNPTIAAMKSPNKVYGTGLDANIGSNSTTLPKMVGQMQMTGFDGRVKGTSHNLTATNSSGTHSLNNSGLMGTGTSLMNTQNQFNSGLAGAYRTGMSGMGLNSTMNSQLGGMMAQQSLRGGMNQQRQMQMSNMGMMQQASMAGMGMGGCVSDGWSRWLDGSLYFH